MLTHAVRRCCPSSKRPDFEKAMVSPLSIHSSFFRAVLSILTCAGFNGRLSWLVVASRCFASSGVMCATPVCMLLVMNSIVSIFITLLFVVVRFELGHSLALCVLRLKGKL